MANKTIYIKDQVLWNQAQDLAVERGVSLSSVIEEGLRQFVALPLSFEGQSIVQVANQIQDLAEFVKRQMRENR